MENQKEQALQVLDDKKEMFWSMSDELWDHPEIGFHEQFAAELYCRTLEREGFRVERNLAGIETAFSGTFGQGSPVIGFLGEFDARRQVLWNRSPWKQMVQAMAAGTIYWEWVPWLRPSRLRNIFRIQERRGL